MATVIKKCGCTDQRRCKHGWVVRYRANGRQHEKTFPHDRKTLANDLAAQVEHEKRSGDYVDPKAGEVTFQVYAERWIAQHPGAANSKNTYRTALKHITPAFGGKAIHCGYGDCRRRSRTLQLGTPRDCSDDRLPFRSTVPR